MVDDKTKNDLLKELEKDGNVSLSCVKVGVNKATFYRWLHRDKIFSKRAKQVIKYGKGTGCDIARHALMLLIKEKNLAAIKYFLSHNDPLYKPKRESLVTLYHKKDLPPPPKGYMCLEELLVDYEDRGNERSMTLYNQLTEGGKLIPPKPDGTPIELNELLQYEYYIRNWQKAKEDKERLNLNSVVKDN
jgi:hypothetical protein